MRRPFRRSSFFLAFAVIAVAGCANRGMKAGDGGRDRPSGDISGTGGAGGRGGTPAVGGSGGDVTGGTGGGASGGGGGGGTIPDDGGGGGTDGPPATCTARFNFESGALHGARLNDAASQEAFKTITNAGGRTFCGGGALQIDSAFSGTTGISVKGELFIPLGRDEDWSGKTITVHFYADPAATGNTSLYVNLVTPSGYYGIPSMTTKPLPAQWTTKSFTFPAVDGGVMQVSNIVIWVYGYDGYAGKIYLDEIDIK
jgi:hypothetical protein